MKITNKLGLPEPIVKAVAGDGRHPHEENTFSATQLEKGVREILLTIRHEDEITEDASDMLWAIFGTAFHKICQDNADGDSEFTEERLTYTMKNGYKISGIVDLYDIDKGLICDYKTTSAWKIVGKEWDDWKQQGLTYAWLLKQNGLPANKIEFYAFLKDFSKRKAASDRDYPQTSAVKVSFDVDDESLAWIDKKIRDKIDLIDKYKNVRDDDLPLCTEEERWNDGDTFAVSKEGRKSSVKNFRQKDGKTYEDARAFMNELQNSHPKDKYYIDVRKGEDRKCAEYCSCCEHCGYYRERYKSSDDKKKDGDDKNVSEK